MSESRQQHPKGRGASDPPITLGSPNYVYAAAAAAAAGLGILVGTAFAATLLRPPAIPKPVTHPAAQRSTVSSGEVVHAAESPSLLSRVEPKAAPVSNPLTGKRSAEVQEPPGSQRAGSLAAAEGHRAQARPGKSFKRKAYVSARSVEAPAPAVESARLEAASLPFFFMVEGDVTVSSFDAATGVIESFEGETFVLDSETAQGGVMPWQETPSNVHFRCDQGGSCTLIHAGIVTTGRRVRSER